MEKNTANNAMISSNDNIFVRHHGNNSLQTETSDKNDDIVSSNPEKRVRFIDECGPKNPKYKNIFKRLDTFEKRSWPPGIPQKPRRLADAGFYYTGLNDEVKCFYCDGIVQCWDPHDDPWAEHIKWFPECGFLKILKMDNTINSSSPTINVSIFKSYNEPSNSVESAEDGNTLQDKNKQNAYSTQTRKLATQCKEVNSSNMEPEVTKNNAAKISAATNNLLLLEEIKILHEEKVCKICLDNEREVVFRPCGHFVSCNKCGLSLKQCPFCRSKISTFLKIYLS